MASPIVAYYWAWNTSTNQGQAGDVANHTIKWSKDGVESPVTNAPAATSQAGQYKVQLTAGEVACRDGLILGTSSTDHVTIVGMQYLFPDPTNVTVTPISSSVDTSPVVSDDMLVYQNETKSFAFGIVDEDENPIDLTGKIVRFTASKHSTPDEALISYDNDAIGGLSITGTDHNTVNITLTGTDTETVQKLIYAIWNVTDDVVLARAFLEIDVVSQP